MTHYRIRRGTPSPEIKEQNINSVAMVNYFQIPIANKHFGAVWIQAGAIQFAHKCKLCELLRTYVHKSTVCDDSLCHETTNSVVFIHGYLHLSALGLHQGS
jgi:hypothetical protein